MGTHEIIDFLKRNKPKKFNAEEIIGFMGFKHHHPPTYRSLRTLRKDGRIQFAKVMGDKIPLYVYWWEDKKPDVVTDELPSDSLNRFFVLERKLSKTLARFKELSEEAGKIKVLYSECQRLKTFKKYSRSRGIVKMYVDLVQEIDTLMSKL